MFDPICVTTGARQDVDLSLMAAGMVLNDRIDIWDAIMVMIAHRERGLAIARVAEGGGDVQGKTLVTAGAREDVDLCAARAGGRVWDDKKVATTAAYQELHGAWIRRWWEGGCGVEDPAPVIAGFTEGVDFDGPAAGVVESNRKEV